MSYLVVDVLCAADKMPLAHALKPFITNHLHEATQCAAGTLPASDNSLCVHAYTISVATLHLGTCRMMGRYM